MAEQEDLAMAFLAEATQLVEERKFGFLQALLGDPGNEGHVRTHGDEILSLICSSVTKDNLESFYKDEKAVKQVDKNLIFENVRNFSRLV